MVTGCENDEIIIGFFYEGTSNINHGVTLTIRYIIVVFIVLYFGAFRQNGIIGKCAVLNYTTVDVSARELVASDFIFKNV
jgi:hypothetical protein